MSECKPILLHHQRLELNRRSHTSSIYRCSGCWSEECSNPNIQNLQSCWYSSAGQTTQLYKWRENLHPTSSSLPHCYLCRQGSCMVGPRCLSGLRWCHHTVRRGIVEYARRTRRVGGRGRGRERWWLRLLSLLYISVIYICSLEKLSTWRTNGQKKKIGWNG